MIVIPESSVRDLRKQLREIMSDKLLLAGFLVEGLAKRYCPVDTGRLRSDIQTKKEDDGVIVFNTVEYAPFVEYGTDVMIRAHGEHDPSNPVTSWDALRKRGGSGQIMPYLRTALHGSVPDIKKLFR